MEPVSLLGGSTGRLILLLFVDLVMEKGPGPLFVCLFDIIFSTGCPSQFKNTGEEKLGGKRFRNKRKG